MRIREKKEKAEPPQHETTDARQGASPISSTSPVTSTGPDGPPGGKHDTFPNLCKYGSRAGFKTITRSARNLQLADF
jgi:hypothetical protein